jgi:hypothetical protein
MLKKQSKEWGPNWKIKKHITNWDWIMKLKNNQSFTKGKKYKN